VTWLLLAGVLGLCSLAVVVRVDTASASIAERQRTDR
jgi:hypothetical protein